MYCVQVVNDVFLVFFPRFAFFTCCLVSEWFVSSGTYPKWPQYNPPYPFISPLPTLSLLFPFSFSYSQHLFSCFSILPILAE